MTYWKRSTVEESEKTGGDDGKKQTGGDDGEKQTEGDDGKKQTGGGDGKEQTGGLERKEGQDGLGSSKVAQNQDTPSRPVEVKVGTMTAICQRAMQREKDIRDMEELQRRIAVYLASLPHRHLEFEDDEEERQAVPNTPESCGTLENSPVPPDAFLRSPYTSLSPTPPPRTPAPINPWTSEWEDDDWAMDEEGSHELEELVERVQLLDAERAERARQDQQIAPAQIGTKRKFLEFPLPTEYIKRPRYQGHPVYWKNNIGNWLRFEMPLSDDISPNLRSLKWDGDPLDVVYIDRSNH